MSVQFCYLELSKIKIVVYGVRNIQGKFIKGQFQRVDPLLLFGAFYRIRSTELYFIKIQNGTGETYNGFFGTMRF